MFNNHLLFNNPLDKLLTIFNQLKALDILNKEKLNTVLNKLFNNLPNTLKSFKVLHQPKLKLNWSRFVDNQAKDTPLFILNQPPLNTPPLNLFNQSLQQQLMYNNQLKLLMSKLVKFRKNQLKAKSNSNKNKSKT